MLMLSNGTPMFCTGDEFLNTQDGNNNPYNQDNDTTWLDWEQLEANRDFFRFFRLLIAFRKAHPTIARSRFWREDVRWYGAGRRGGHVLFESRHLAFYLDGAAQHDVDLYLMINAHEEERVFEIQEPEPTGWRRVCDTSQESPDDVSEPGREPRVYRNEYVVDAHSVVLLMRPR